jgi:hypothetical protein
MATVSARDPDSPETIVPPAHSRYSTAAALTKTVANPSFQVRLMLTPFPLPRPAGHGSRAAIGIVSRAQVTGKVTKVLPVYRAGWRPDQCTFLFVVSAHSGEGSGCTPGKCPLLRPRR